MGDDFPLLASPAPHVGQVSPVPRASPGGEANSGAWNRTLSWKRLLVNSPPAWAASPDKYMGRMGVEGSPGEGSWPSWRSAPPFPAPSLGPGPGPNPPRLPPNLRQEGEGKFSQDEEDEISRFLSHVSISPTAYAEDIGKLGHEPPPKTPSPRRRGFRDAQDDTLSTAWTPFSALNTSGQDSGFATEGPSGAFLEGPASTGSQRMQRPRGSGQGAADHSTLLQTSSPAGPSSPGVAADTQTNPTIELGEVLPALLLALPSLLFTILLYFVDREVSLEKISIGDVWSGLTVTLSILIGFRTQQALERFWEGTSLLHQMRGEYFDSVSCLVSFSQSALESKPAEVLQFRQTLVRLVSHMHESALDEIAGCRDRFPTIDKCSLDDETLRFVATCQDKYGWNRVLSLQHMIQVLITHHIHTGMLDIPPPILSRVYQTLSRGLVNLLNAVKIKDTSFPFPWAQMITCLLAVHTVYTPFIIVSITTSLYWALPVSFVPIFGMIALNLVASELEMPFGTDENDLPLHHFQREMNQGLLLLLHERSDHIPSTRANATQCIDELMSCERGEKVRSLSRYQSQSLDDLDDIEADELITKEPKCIAKQESKEESKAVDVAVQGLRNQVDIENKLDKDMIAISQNSKALATFADDLTPVMVEHEAALYKLMDTLPQLEAVFKGVQVALRTCSCCGRRFRESRLPVHEEICYRNAGTGKKRSVFESSRQRCSAVSGRWWSTPERKSNAGSQSRQGQNSRACSPQVSRQPSKGVPVVQRSRSTPTMQGTHSRRSPEGRSPRPSHRRADASGPKQSTTTSPANKVFVTSPVQKPERSRSCAGTRSRSRRESLRGAGRADLSRSHGHQAEAAPEHPAAARRTVSAERLRFTSSSPVAPDVSATTEPAQCGLGSEGRPQRAWGAVPAMPDLEGFQSSEQATGTVFRARRSFAETDKQEALGNSGAAGDAPFGLLGSIIEDVAQLSAQVEKLLSRRKDVLKGSTGHRYYARASSDVRDAALELSRSDSSVAEGDAVAHSRASTAAGASASGGA
ncbi:unnamed protein product [Symbiodinium microadriaticum]|nr:unnamed protein product [Symbiodinium microadriaticum]